MDNLKRKYTNNTLEEELREMLCEQHKELSRLRVENEILRKTVALEVEEKYHAYQRLSQLGVSSPPV